MGTKQATKKKEKKQTPQPFVSLRIWRVTLGIVLSCAVIALAVFGCLAYINFAYADEVFPGVKIGALSLSGMSKNAVRSTLEDRVATLETEGILVQHGTEQSVIDSTVAPKSGIDTAFPLFLLDIETVADEALQYGRGENGLRNSWDRLVALFSPKELRAPIAFQNHRFIDVLQDQYGEFETPAVDAQLVADEQNAFTISPASSGSVFPYETYAQDVQQSLTTLSQPRIVLSLQTEEPDVTEADVQAVQDAAQVAVASAPYRVAWEDKTWELSPAQTAQALVVRPGSELTFSEEGLDPFLKPIREAIDVEAKDARFAVEGGKVVEFQASAAGRTVDVQALINALTQRIAQPNAQEKIVAEVREVAPEITESEADSLGITELVATASTNFAGSPTNRRKNIANGVRLLNGMLIKPGETFSLVKALSPIDTANGYLPELVIKGNRTIPEVGGGLCQIGTTLFRTTLNAGLPIVERRNHSYRVSYYEPPVGMDATIYDPAPDFKFTNDYENNLLLLGRVEGDNVFFDFWGTKDLREVTLTDPKIYNITTPGPTKYIETEDLAPGEQKCIERAHNGASAEFTYTVAYANGETKEETFYSKYKAWQAVCLVGKAVE